MVMDGLHDSTQRVDLLTSHGKLLLFLAAHPAASLRDAASALDLSGRTVTRVLGDLRAEGWVEVTADGTRHRYVVRPGRSVLERPIPEHDGLGG